MFKVNNGQWRRFGSFILNFEHISHFCSNVSVVNFKQVNAGWEQCKNGMTITCTNFNHAKPS